MEIQITATEFIEHIEMVKPKLGLKVHRIDNHLADKTNPIIKITEFWCSFRNEPFKTAIGEIFWCDEGHFTKSFLHQDGEPAEDIQFWKPEITSKLGKNP